MCLLWNDFDALSKQGFVPILENDFDNIFHDDMTQNDFTSDLSDEVRKFPNNVLRLETHRIASKGKLRWVL